MLYTNDKITDSYEAREKAKLLKEIKDADEAIGYYTTMGNIPTPAAIPKPLKKPFASGLKKALNAKESAEEKLRKKQLESVRKYKEMINKK